MEPYRAWHEDEAFWEAFRDFVFPPEKVEAGGDEVDRMLDLLDRPADDGRVLDVPCGVGRHAVEFADRGFDVTAVDATEPFVEAARERVADAGVEDRVEVVHDDMRAFRRPDTFDLAVNVYTSFGYFEDRADDERVARNVYESLVPGGRFLMTLTSKEVLAGKFEERGWVEQDGAYMLEERAVTDDWSWMENRWIAIRDGETREFDVSHRLYSAYELTDLLGRAGFDTVDVYGDLDGSAYDEDAEHLVVVAARSA